MELFKQFLPVLISFAFIACATKPVPENKSMTPKERKAANFEILKSHRVEIDHCVRIAWDETARDNKQTAVFVWEIEQDGQVGDVTFDDRKTTLKDSELIECLKTASKTWAFVKSENAEPSKISITYSFR